MARAKFDSLFRTASIRRSAVIGMVHVQALPGIRHSPVAAERRATALAQLKNNRTL